MAKIQSNGIAINYRIDGPDDAPWVTFVTGITNDLTMWDQHIPVLSERYRLLRLDTRGHGGSESTPAPYSFTQLSNDVLGVWDALGIEKSILVGIGLGGVTTIATALRAPDRLVAIVPTSCRTDLIPTFVDLWTPMIADSTSDGIEAIVERTATRWFPQIFQEENPELMDNVRAQIRATSVDGYHGCIAALLTTDFKPRLGELSMPALFISGALDTVGAPSDVMVDMAAAAPNGRYVALPGAGHISNMASPREFETAVLDFLDSL